MTERVRRVVELLARLPGVGEKTAQRYLLHLLTTDERLARELGAELTSLRDHVKPCARCGNLAEVEVGAPVLCEVCADHRRDPSLLCVVARVQDLSAIERSGAMRRVEAWKQDPSKHHRIRLLVTGLCHHLRSAQVVAEVKKSNPARASLGHFLAQLGADFGLPLVETLKLIGVTPIRPGRE